MQSIRKMWEINPSANIIRKESQECWFLGV